MLYTFSPKRQIVADYRAYMDAVIANARKPSWVRIAPPPAPRDPVSRMMVTPGSARPAWNRRDAQWRNLELRLASRAYRLLLQDSRNYRKGRDDLGR